MRIAKQAFVYNESECRMEAIRRVEVENFPAFTVIDDKAMTSSRK
jgi:tartrate dehydratase beta subunit/fumarate hydratase class I family protein